MGKMFSTFQQKFNRFATVHNIEFPQKMKNLHLLEGKEFMVIPCDHHEIIHPGQWKNGGVVSSQDPEGITLPSHTEELILPIFLVIEMGRKKGSPRPTTKRHPATVHRFYGIEGEKDSHG